MGGDPKIKNSGSAFLGSLVKGLENLIRFIATTLFLLWVLCILLSIGYESFVWLKTGKWLGLRFSTGFAWLDIDVYTLVRQVEWKGVQKFLLWFLKLPLSIGITLAGVSFGFFLGILHAIFLEKKT